MPRAPRRRTDNLVTMPSSRVEDETMASSRVGETVDDDIARRAYELFEQRGGEHGRDMEDWLAAERELRGAAASTAA